ncbi:unnamed protein product [Onchocerca flexuosa]|uniref:Uncharacterized protein n=1 Tax=Onchocerca flexuosa TaxID=387005 RepID=A0A183HPK7_9BILA|nr:unnamed protein product [Onchocerca flexuosa]
MAGSDKNRCSISKRHNTQFSTLPAKSRQLLPAPISRNSSAQPSAATAEVQHLSTRGRKRKKQNIHANQPSVLSVPHYPAFMVPSTSNDLKEIQMPDERQQHITVATTATAACMNATRIPRIIQNENFAATATVIRGVSGTSAPMIPGLFQLPQDLSGFSELTAYFSTDNNTGTVRHDQSYQWPPSTKTNYWPSSSDLYYQNYMTNNAS